MQATEAPTTMLAMPGTRERGRMARLAILRELDRRERAGVRPPTYDELATMLDVSRPAARKHVLRLVALEMVTLQADKYRSAALTDKGRGLAREF